MEKDFKSLIRTILQELKRKLYALLGEDFPKDQYNHLLKAYQELEEFSRKFTENMEQTIIKEKLPITCDCPCCGEKSDSIDPKVLCKECRETYGHSFIDDL